MDERTTEHLQDLRQQLRLTSEQEAAWNSFVRTVQETIARMPQAMPSAEPEAYDTTLNAHLEMVCTIRDALSELSTYLNDAQKDMLAMATAAVLGRARAAEADA